MNSKKNCLIFVELSENKQTKLEIGQLWQEDNEGNTIQRLVST